MVGAAAEEEEAEEEEEEAEDEDEDEEAVDEWAPGSRLPSLSSDRASGRARIGPRTGPQPGRDLPAARPRRPCGALPGPRHPHRIRLCIYIIRVFPGPIADFEATQSPSPGPSSHARSEDSDGPPARRAPLLLTSA